MKIIFHVLLAATILIAARSTTFAAAFAGGAADPESFSISGTKMAEWAAFDGANIERIEVDGLRWTRLRAIEWMMHTKQSTPFNAGVFVADLQILYNTGNLYDLDGSITRSADGNSVVVRVILKDKWTLFPALGAQGGGGSFTLGGGIFESNLLGYMANASATFWTFNGTTSYDLNLNQEYLAGTQTMWSLDFQDSIEPQQVHTYDNNEPGLLAWRRESREIMVGTHLGENIRLKLAAAVFRDSIVKNEGGFHTSDAVGMQNRLSPRMILGRVNWTNYLENGFETTIGPSFYNLVGGGAQYATVDATYKNVWTVGRKSRDNMAIFLSTTLMDGGPNYTLQAGGYYNVRGYTDLRQFGHRLAFANFEYRPFLFSYRWSLLDLDLMAVQAAFFSDVGSAWGNSTLTGEARADSFRPLWSAGAGLRINMVKFSGAILRLDLARTISPDEGLGFSFGVGQFF